jgi:hypothetical protein
VPDRPFPTDNPAVRSAVAGSLATTFGFAFADLPAPLKERLVDDVLARSGDWPNGGMAWHDAARQLAAEVPQAELAAYAATLDPAALAATFVQHLYSDRADEDPERPLGPSTPEVGQPDD